MLTCMHLKLVSWRLLIPLGATMQVLRDIKNNGDSMANEHSPRIIDTNGADAFDVRMASKHKSAPLYLFAVAVCC